MARSNVSVLALALVALLAAASAANAAQPEPLNNRRLLGAQAAASATGAQAAASATGAQAAARAAAAARLMASNGAMEDDNCELIHMDEFCWEGTQAYCCTHMTRKGYAGCNIQSNTIVCPRSRPIPVCCSDDKRRRR